MMRNTIDEPTVVARDGAPAMAREIVVRFRGIAKSFDGATLVVRNLDLDVLRGEFLTLLGPSGSGKTTTLMLLAGFEAPTAGDIVLDGISLANVPPHRRDIGVVFQNYALFPHMTVGKNVAFPLSVRGLASDEVAERVTRALDMVRLDGYAERRPSQLSGGEQQRVALARALVFAPKLILMDEPLGALDRQLREHMQLEIRALHQRLGITVIYVTHDQAEALTMSDRVAVFSNGAVQQLDVPKVLYEAPANAFVARFIGENNRLSGCVVENRHGHCTVRLDGGAMVTAVPRDVGATGERTTLSVRPERIVLSQAAMNGAPTNQLTARVVEVIYLGDHLRTRLFLEGVGEVMAKLPATSARPALVPGMLVVAEWRTDDCLAFAPEIGNEPRHSIVDER